LRTLLRAPDAAQRVALAKRCAAEPGPLRTAARYYGANAKWAERAAAFLKHKLRDTEVTHAELAKRLEKHGLKETEASITNKLSRGTFPATFSLACIAALELEGVALEEI